MEKRIDIYHGHDAFYLRGTVGDLGYDGDIQIRLWSRGSFGVTIQLSLEDSERFAEELLAFTKSVLAASEEKA